MATHRSVSSNLSFIVIAAFLLLLQDRTVKSFQPTLDTGLLLRRNVATRKQPSLLSSSSRRPSLERSRMTLAGAENEDDISESTSSPLLPDRRSALTATARILLGGSLTSLTLLPASASAASTTTTPTPQEYALRLRRIPVFAIVTTTGIPYVIYGRNAKRASRFFFTSYMGALQVLQDAKVSAKTEADKMTDVNAAKEMLATWDSSTIVPVPLDFAMRLCVKETRSTAQNGMALDTIGDVVPLGEDNEDATRIDSSGRYSQLGRVPLFYFDNFNLPPLPDGTVRSPVYLHRSDLLKAWNDANPNVTPPRMKVRELYDTYQFMVSGSGKDEKGESLKDIYFVPPEENMMAARELFKVNAEKGMSGGGNKNYRLDEMMLVSGTL